MDDGWVDGWVGGWVDGWVGGWIDGWMNRWKTILQEENILNPYGYLSQF